MDGQFPKILLSTQSHSDTGKLQTKSAALQESVTAPCDVLTHVSSKTSYFYIENHNRLQVTRSKQRTRRPNYKIFCQEKSYRTNIQRLDLKPSINLVYLKAD